MYARFLLVGLFVLAATPAQAQRAHLVTVRSFEFDPSSLFIAAGDTVRWQNVQGAHGVLETTTGTPAGFHQEVEGAPWEYDFVFESAGEFFYRCIKHPFQMTGSITVVGGTSTEDEVPAEAAVSAAHPNPFAAATAFTIRPARNERVRVVVYDPAGRQIAVLHDAEVAAGTALRVSWTPAGLPSGTYLIRIEGESLSLTRRVTHVR